LAQQQQQKNMAQLQMQQQQPLMHSPPFQPNVPAHGFPQPQPPQGPSPQAPMSKGPQQPSAPVVTQGLGSPVPFNNHVRTNSSGSPHMGMIPATPMEGAGLGVNHAAEHGKLSPMKEGGTTTLGPLTVEQLIHNDKKQVLWFSAPPLDVIPVPKPHHSVEYLAKKQKLSKDRSFQSNRTTTSVVLATTANDRAALELEQMASLAENALPVVLQGLDALKEQLSADVKVIQSN
ncbi:hypothetical protein BG006_011271, partial [Podila minutissima]